jgi:hypothetical protein
LVITVWLVAGHSQTETLAGYRFQSECAEDIERAVAGRMSMPGVVSASARCEKEE